jgi:Rrf2 family protein
MLSLTRKTDYALVALARLAEADVSEANPASARQIAAEYHLPMQVLVKVLKELQRAGIIGSTRGAHGGYFLRQSPKAVSIATVTEAMEGTAKLTPCCDDEAGPCDACDTHAVCPVTDRVRRLNEAIQRLFKQVTLHHLLTDELPPVLEQLTWRGRAMTSETR